MNSWFENILRFIVVVFLQVLLINNLHFLGIVSPFIYILFLLALPATISQLWLLIIGFCTGLVMDMFCNSPGIHAAACTAICMLRPYLLAWQVKEQERLTGTISSESLTWGTYLRYLTVMTLVHHTLVFALTAFTFHAAWMTVLQIVLSSLLTMVLLIFWELVRKK